jgi:pyridoxamine-phosphate oxidase
MGVRAMIEDIRKSYELGELTEAEAGDDPFALLRRWLDDALQANLIEPNAMCLATVDEQGNPDARFVLLRGLDDAGLVFYTNANSTKGRQLAHRPYATLVFWWGALERQIRLRGRIEQVSDAEADAYFARRPRAGTSSRRGSRPRASRFRAVRGWSSAPPRWSASSRGAKCPARRTGQAISSSPTPSSFGRVVGTACTIGSCSRASLTGVGRVCGLRLSYSARGFSGSSSRLFNPK